MPLTKFDVGDKVQMWIPTLDPGVSAKLIPEWRPGFTISRPGRNPKVYYLKDKDNIEMPVPISVRRLRKFFPREDEPILNPNWRKQEERTDLKIDGDKVNTKEGWTALKWQAPDDAYVPPKAQLQLKDDWEVIVKDNPENRKIIGRGVQRKDDKTLILDPKISKKGEILEIVSDPETWIHRQLRVWWDDTDGKRWEQGTILSQKSKMFFIVDYPFLRKYKEEQLKLKEQGLQFDKEVLAPDYHEVEENLLGANKVRWEII